MPDYRRAYTPGGAIFLTLVTFNRRPIFAEPNNVKRLRQAAATVKAEIWTGGEAKKWILASPLSAWERAWWSGLAEAL